MWWKVAFEELRVSGRVSGLLQVLKLKVNTMTTWLGLGSDVEVIDLLLPLALIRRFLPRLKAGFLEVDLE